MSSLDADVNIRLNAEDNASQPIDNSVKSIDRSFIQMRNGLRANERSFYLQHQSIYKLNQIMGTLRHVTGAGIQVMNTMLLSQIRNQQAAKNLRDAIRDQSDAFAEFGAGSREFSDAQERVNEVIQEQKDQVIQDTLQWITLGSYLVGTILPVITKIASRMKGTTVPTIPTVPVPVTGSTPPVPVAGSIPTPAKPGGFVGPMKPSTGAGSGPTVGGGGMGLIGPAALGLTLMEAALSAAGIEKQTGRTDMGFQQLENLQTATQQTTVTVIVDGKTYQGVYD